MTKWQFSLSHPLSSHIINFLSHFTPCTTCTFSKAMGMLINYSGCPFGRVAGPGCRQGGYEGYCRFVISACVAPWHHWIHPQHTPPHQGQHKSHCSPPCRGPWRLPPDIGRTAVMGPQCSQSGLSWGRWEVLIQPRALWPPVIHQGAGLSPQGPQLTAEVISLIHHNTMMSKNPQYNPCK